MWIHMFITHMPELFFTSLTFAAAKATLSSTRMRPLNVPVEIPMQPTQYVDS